MKPSAISIVGLCGLVPALCAQQVATAAPIGLKPTSRIELPFNNSMQMQAFGAGSCDRNGNIYARPRSVARGSGPNAARLAPVQQITPGGNLVRVFKLPDAWGEIPIPTAGFVDSSGAVFQVVRLQQTDYVVQFAEDGSVKSKTKLETGADVMPYCFVVFRSGGLLLSGETGIDARTPFLALFEPDGRLVKKIYEPEDEEARGSAETGDIRFAHSIVGNAYVSHGDATLGSDGNAYVMHGVSPTLVYAISPTGVVLRKFRVASSEPGSEPWSIRSYDGRLAFPYAVNRHLEIQVTDLEGNSVAGYSMASKRKADDPDILDLACYDSNGFTLISIAAGGNLYLLRAKPR